MDQREKVRENRLRRMAQRLGLDIRKSRVRTVHVDDLGGYRVLTRDGEFLAGERHELSLDDVEAILADREKEIQRERRG